MSVGEASQSVYFTNDLNQIKLFFLMFKCNLVPTSVSVSMHS